MIFGNIFFLVGRKGLRLFVIGFNPVGNVNNLQKLRETLYHRKEIKQKCAHSFIFEKYMKRNVQTNENLIRPTSVNAIEYIECFISISYNNTILKFPL